MSGHYYVNKCGVFDLIFDEILLEHLNIKLCRVSSEKRFFLVTSWVVWQEHCIFYSLSLGVKHNENDKNYRESRIMLDILFMIIYTAAPNIVVSEQQAMLPRHRINTTMRMNWIMKTLFHSRGAHSGA